MSGNKTDNGVHEVGTDEIRKAYQDDTPGQQVEKYLSQIKEVNEAVQKKHFSTKYPNPLKGYPYQKEETESVEERHSDVMKKRTQSQQKAHQKAMMKSAKKSIKDYDAKNKNKNEEKLQEVFRPNPELRDVRKLDKMLESAYKSMNKLQNGKSLYLRKCNDGIVDARRALDEYVDAIESGKLD
jgi:hypothetical protein